MKRGFEEYAQALAELAGLPTHDFGTTSDFTASSLDGMLAGRWMLRLESPLKQLERRVAKLEAQQ